MLVHHFNYHDIKKKKRVKKPAFPVDIDRV